MMVYVTSHSCVAYFLSLPIPLRAQGRAAYSTVSPPSCYRVGLHAHGIGSPSSWTRPEPLLLLMIASLMAALCCTLNASQGAFAPALCSNAATPTLFPPPAPAEPWCGPAAPGDVVCVLGLVLRTLARGGLLLSDCCAGLVRGTPTAESGGLRLTTSTSPVRALLCSADEARGVERVRAGACGKRCVL